MLLEFDIERHNIGHPKSYLNNYRIGGSKWTSGLSISFAFEVERKIVDKLINKPLYLFSRKSHDGEVVSLSLLTKEDGILQEACTDYFSTKNMPENEFKRIVLSQDTLFINLGYLDVDGSDFIEKRQPQKDEVADIYLQKIESFQDIEKKFAYLNRFGNEVLTKTHPDISSKELLADKGILLKEVMKFIEEKRPLYELKNFNIQNKKENYQESYQDFIQSLFLAMSPFGSKFTNTFHFGESKKRIGLEFCNNVCLNGKIINVLLGSEDSDWEREIKSYLQKLNFHLDIAFKHMMNGENSLKRNRKKVLEELTKSEEIYNSLCFSWLLNDNFGLSKISQNV